MDEKRSNDTARLEEEVARFKTRLAATQSEAEALKAAVAEAEALKAARDEERKAVISLLEDLNETTAKISMAEREWVATFDAIESPIFVHDSDFRIVRANKAYQRLAGLKFREFIGRPYYEVFPLSPKPPRSCVDAIGLNEPREDEAAAESVGRVFRTRYYPVPGLGGAGALYTHVMEDVTEARRAEERLREEMEITSSLLAVASATARATDLNTLLDHAVESINQIMRSDACLAYLYDAAEMEFRPVSQRGLAQEDGVLFRASDAGPLMKASFEEKAPFVRQGGGILPWLEWAGTIAAAPLKGRAGMLGVIVGVYGKPKDFAERDMKVMAGFSDHVSLAVEQARLYRESVEKSLALSHQLKTIRVMHEIDASILSTLDADTILDTTARMVEKLIPCERVYVVLADREKRLFTVATGYGARIASKSTTMPFDDTSATEVVETGSPQYTPDLSAEPERKRLEEALLKEGFLSHIRVPLTVKGEITGLVSVGSRKAAAYTAEDLSTLEKLASQMGVALENARLVDDLNDLFTATVSTLSSALDAKSRWTAGHSERVTSYALAMAREMGLAKSAMRELELAGLLHDIGKIGTYEAVLDKPGRLTDDELGMMRQHPGKGGEILGHIKQMKNIIPAIRHHHEHYDGSGYPDGLKGQAIPVLARILAVADAADAMSADRPYRKGKPAEEVIAEVKRCEGTHFDPAAAEAFLRIYKASGEKGAASPA